MNSDLDMVARLIGVEFRNMVQAMQQATSPMREFGVSILKTIYIFGTPHQRHKAWRALKRTGVNWPNPARHGLTEIADS